MTARLRPELADLPAYTPGKTVPGAIKIASNETVHGPLPSVRAAIEKATDNINRYPDNGYIELKERLAKHVNFAPEHISVGCGSVSLCQQLIQITSTVGDEVLYGWRSFEIYPLQVRTAGATPGPGAADRLHLRPRRDAGRDHRPHPAHLRVQPEQPDQHRRRPRRAWPGSSRPCRRTS